MHAVLNERAENEEQASARERGNREAPPGEDTEPTLNQAEEEEEGGAPTVSEEGLLEIDEGIPLVSGVAAHKAFASDADPAYTNKMKPAASNEAAAARSTACGGLRQEPCVTNGPTRKKLAAPAAYDADVLRDLAPEAKGKVLAKRKALAKKLFSGHYGELRSMRHMAMLQLGGFSGMGFSKMVCKVRVALSVAKETNPSLLKHVKASAVFTKYKDELNPLLACVQNKAKTDKQCTSKLFALIFDADKILPEVKKLEAKLGKHYKAAAAWGCDGHKKAGH